MSAYWVARSKIHDPVEYKKYTDRVPAIIARFGGKVLARGGRFQILEEPQKFHRLRRRRGRARDRRGRRRHVALKAIGGYVSL